MNHSRSHTTIRNSALGLTCSLVFGMIGNSAHAQAVGVPIESDEVLVEDAPLVAKAAALKQAGKLLSIKQVEAALKSPKPSPLVLPLPSTNRLEPRAIAELGRKALVRVGWFYLEKGTKHWHVNLADGYSITTDGAVATCHHCVDPEEQEMIEGFLIASDSSGNVLPVTAVLAQDKEMDVAILRVEGGNFAPLPLNDQTAPGDAVYVFSDPMSVVGYFSTGMLNRFFWLDGKGSTNPTSIEGARNLRIHVSADWAPGSSGAALMDVCGNAIGHVSVIDPLVSDDPLPTEKKTEKPDKKSPKTPPPAPVTDNSVLMILHEAVSARGVRMLAESMKVPAPAAVDAK
ncbi:MAG: serine protease [Luteolibacter sp.]